MCRHLAYLGPSATLRSVLIDPPHGLYRQAWAPRRQRHGTVNADGFGIGWYADGDPVPARYRRGRADLGRPVAARPRAGHPVGRGAGGGARRHAGHGARAGGGGAVRGGPWLFSHNGAAEGWRDWGRPRTGPGQAPRGGRWRGGGGGGGPTRPRGGSGERRRSCPGQARPASVRPRPDGGAAVRPGQLARGGTAWPAVLPRGADRLGAAVGARPAAAAGGAAA